MESTCNSNVNMVRFENTTSFSAGVQSSIAIPRWQRKKMEAAEKGEEKTSSACKGAHGALRSNSQNAASTPRRLKRRSSSREGMTPSHSSRKRQACGDRFVHSRSSMDFDALHYHVTKSQQQDGDAVSGDTESKVADGKSRPAESPKTKEFKAALQNELLSKPLKTDGEGRKKANILAYRHKPAVPLESQRMGNVLYSQNKAVSTHRRAKSSHMRMIPSQPERILDAPDLRDDYYLNLIEWSSSNILAVALGPTVYLWNATDGSINELFTLENEDDYVSSLSWVPNQDNYLAVGTAEAESVVSLWDVSQNKRLQMMR